MKEYPVLIFQFTDINLRKKFQLFAESLGWENQNKGKESNYSALCFNKSREGATLAVKKYWPCIALNIDSKYSLYVKIHDENQFKKYEEILRIIPFSEKKIKENI